MINVRLQQLAHSSAVFLFTVFFPLEALHCSVQLIYPCFANKPAIGVATVGLLNLVRTSFKNAIYWRVSDAALVLLSRLKPGRLDTAMTNSPH